MRFYALSRTLQWLVFINSHAGPTHPPIQHREAFPAEEFATLHASSERMVSELDAACHRSSDPPDRPAAPVTARMRTGKRGRPKVHIEPTFLREALTLRGPTGIAPVLGCSSRTVRRRALEHGLAAPAPPVFETTTLPDGETARTYNVPRVPEPPETSDEELDRLLLDALAVFPTFGRSMLKGYLAARGISVSRSRLRAAYIRVHGAPIAWGNREIYRRGYHVAGANSLWHHDGQHGEYPYCAPTRSGLTPISTGLIKYKIVQHCFIDGKSRLVVGIRANDNNRKHTVLRLFLDATDVHGIPSRVRGDHGVENIEVAAWMEVTRGPDRGSYIWGRSVHNTRIERLWYDVTQKYGRKWKIFFHQLEVHHFLNPQVPEHIWLLHHLFLAAINQDAQDWMHAWNNHKLQIAGERTRSPRDIFFYSQVQDGPRGMPSVPVPPEDNDPIDEASYGVDWDVTDDPEFMRHLMEQNPQEFNAQNPFQTGPEQFAEVICEPPGCPFAPEEVQWLDEMLRASVDMNSRDMVVRRRVWVTALELCNQMWTL